MVMPKRDKMVQRIERLTASLDKAYEELKAFDAGRCCEPFCEKKGTIRDYVTPFYSHLVCAEHATDGAQARQKIIERDTA